MHVYTIKPLERHGNVNARLKLSPLGQRREGERVWEPLLGRAQVGSPLPGGLSLCPSSSWAGCGFTGVLVILFHDLCATHVFFYFVSNVCILKNASRSLKAIVLHAVCLFLGRLLAWWVTPEMVHIEPRELVGVGRCPPGQRAGRVPRAHSCWRGAASARLAAPGGTCGGPRPCGRSPAACLRAARPSSLRSPQRRPLHQKSHRSRELTSPPAAQTLEQT